MGYGLLVKEEPASAQQVPDVWDHQVPRGRLPRLRGRASQADIHRAQGAANGPGPGPLLPRTSSRGWLGAGAW